MAPSSRFASSLRPNVAYLDLNFDALWKKQTTFPSLAYAGIPYQVFGERTGAPALTGQLFFRHWRATHTRTAEVLGSAGLTPALFALLNVVGAREGAIQARARRLIAQVEDEVLARLPVEERRELLALLRRALDLAPPQPLWSSDEGD
jgi:hypothetical protein